MSRGRNNRRSEDVGTWDDLNYDQQLSVIETLHDHVVEGGNQWAFKAAKRMLRNEHKLVGNFIDVDWNLKNWWKSFLSRRRIPHNPSLYRQYVEQNEITAVDVLDSEEGDDADNQTYGERSQRPLGVLEKQKNGKVNAQRRRDQDRRQSKELRASGGHARTGAGRLGAGHHNRGDGFMSRDVQRQHDTDPHPQWFIRHHPWSQKLGPLTGIEMEQQLRGYFDLNEPWNAPTIATGATIHTTDKLGKYQLPVFCFIKLLDPSQRTQVLDDTKSHMQLRLLQQMEDAWSEYQGTVSYSHCT
jgi:hypothetical protein